MDKETLDAVLQIIAERRTKRKKKKTKKKKKKATTPLPSTTISIPMNVSGNDSKVRTVVFNRDRTLSIKEQLKDDPEIGDLLKRLTSGKSGKTLKNRKKSPDALEELTSRAGKGSLSLIYALQKDVKDLAKKITQPIQQSTIPYGQRGTDRLDIQSGVQRAIAEEKRKLNISDKPLTKAELKKFESDIIEVNDGLGNTRKVNQTKSTIKPKKKAIVISPFTQPQGIREFAVGMMNPPDIGGGGGMDTLPLPEDYLKTPTWRSTIDEIERPSLREVLAEPPPGIPYYGDETIIPLEGEMDGVLLDEMDEGTIAELPDEGQDFGDGGGDDMVDDEPRQPRRKVVVSGEPIVVSGKKKGGRPAGSKNKPKPPPSEPSQIARLGGSSVVGITPKGKTPANSPQLE